MTDSSKSRKQKTLYGRYDDYAASIEDPPRRGATAVRLTADPAHARRATKGRGGPPSPAPLPTPCAKQPTARHTEGAVILRVVAEESEGGEYPLLTVTLELPGADGCRREERVRLLTEQYADLGLRIGSISDEMVEQILRAGELCRAIGRGLASLSYGDTSARGLTGKLIRHGIDRSVADEAVAWLMDRGMLREDSAALSRAVEGARKGWGIRRIRQDLMAHGYPAEATEEALSALQDPDGPFYVDMEAACLAQLQRRVGGDLSCLHDRPFREKLIAALLRQGFEMDEIRESMRALQRKYSSN